MGVFDKIKEANQRVKIAGAVAKIVLGGKGSKVLEKIDSGSNIADKALEIAEMVRQMFPPKNKGEVKK